MDHLTMYVLERERHEVRLRDAEIERLARARGAVDDRPGPERHPRWPHRRLADRLWRLVAHLPAAAIG